MAAVTMGIATVPAIAADYAVHPRVASERYETIDRGPNPYCGARCGCPNATFVRHRQLVQFYPSSFDPREKLEPYYRYGGMKTYARFEKQDYSQ
jgi:hypothetical protein